MPESSTTSKTDKPKMGLLPPYKVLLHNDDINTADFVLEKIVELIHLEETEAIEKVTEAHKTGVSLLLVTHRERAEFLCEQFKTYNITTTWEKE